jgi:hypothetical protein
MSPFTIACRAADGDRWALCGWDEYSIATKGVHKLRWSRGLRKRLGLGQELTDDEAADDTVEREHVCDLTDEETRLVLRVPELQTNLCEAAEEGGADGVRDYLVRVLTELGWRERVELRRWGRHRTGRCRSPVRA